MGERTGAGVRYVEDLPATADLVVIGGGVIGAATAFHAVRAGFHPLVFERRPAFCSLTTAVAAGGFRLQLDNEEELRLVAETVEMLLDFRDATGQAAYDPGVRQQGYLWLTTTNEGAERQRRLVEAQREWGVDDVEVLDGDEARRLFPFVSPDVIQARFRQADGLFDPKELTFGLAAGSGAPVALECGALGFRITHGRLAGVQTTRGFVATETAVIAAGPFSGPLAALADVELPVTTVRRQKLVMPDVAEVPSGAPMTVDDDTGVHWRPAFNGAVLLFTDPSTPPSEPSDIVPIDHAFAFQLLRPDSPTAAARVAPFWREVWDRGNAHWMLQAGQYTETPDGRPLLGQSSVEGLFVNAGHGGRGVMGGPAMSRHLVDVLTGKIGPEANPFRLDRSFEPRPRLDPL